MTGRAVRDWSQSLAELRWHWDTAYIIECFGLGAWVARRRDGRCTLHADSAELLRDMIMADYTARPVPRDLAPS
ncbi:MAG: hypothetical protein JO132_12750 [Streptosporangiaceae bacterium]|nr:hypothetical protein [Streptosporangiaceae bacterium]